MDQGLSTGSHQFSDGLRERNSRADSTVSREALTAVGEVEVKDKDGNELKTFGRTPDGTGKRKEHHTWCAAFDLQRARWDRGT